MISEPSSTTGFVRNTLKVGFDVFKLCHLLSLPHASFRVKLSKGTRKHVLLKQTVCTWFMSHCTLSHPFLGGPCGGFYHENRPTVQGTVLWHTHDQRIHFQRSLTNCIFTLACTYCTAYVEQLFFHATSAQMSLSFDEPDIWFLEHHRPKHMRTEFRHPERPRCPSVNSKLVHFADVEMPTVTHKCWFVTKGALTVGKWPHLHQLQHSLKQNHTKSWKFELW